MKIEANATAKIICETCKKRHDVELERELRKELRQRSLEAVQWFIDKYKIKDCEVTHYKSKKKKDND